MSIDKEAFPFVTVVAAIALLSLYFGWTRTAIVLVILALAIAAFFRDPQRTIPIDPQAVVSPADGKVVEIAPGESYPLAPGQTFTRISIFLSVFNVHINRAPIAGSLSAYAYHPGKFLMAFSPKASLDNEQSHLLITTPTGTAVGVKQIAGLIARRIVTRAKVGDSLTKGQRFGLIRFGSRVDIFLPPSAVLKIKKGDVVRGGESILATL